MQRITRQATRVLSSLRSIPSRQNTSRTTAPAFHPSTTTRATAKMSSSATTNAYIDLLKSRRTYYALNKDLSAATPARIQEIVKEILQHVPSSFNSQSNRVVVLFNEEHDKFWDIATSTLKAIVPEDKWEPTAQRMAMFKGAAGSVLFFEDTTVVEGMQAKFAIYADRFPGWSTQSSGMAQHALWVALEAEGLGANLQHYNPLVDAKVAETWNLPATWKLNAQLVFGGRAGEPGEKTFAPIEEKFKAFGA